MGYTTAMWLGFGEALAAVSGAQTGLLFVALSVKSDVLAASRRLSEAPGGQSPSRAPLAPLRGWGCARLLTELHAVPGDHSQREQADCLLG